MEASMLSSEAFLTIQTVAVPDCEKDDHQAHPEEADGAPDIEEPVSVMKHYRPAQQGQVPDSEQQAQLCRAKTPERKPKFAEGVSREIGLNREHEEAD